MTCKSQLCSTFDNCMLPKRRFWKTEQKIGRVSAHGKYFSMVWAQDLGYNPLKLRRKETNRLFRFPKSSFGEHPIVETPKEWIDISMIYQWRAAPGLAFIILQSWINTSDCIFEAFLKGVSTGFGLRNVEKCFENAFWNVDLAFQNLRLESIKLLQKIVASQKTQHIAVAIFCNHLAKLLQKIIASQKTNPVDTIFRIILQSCYEDSINRNSAATCDATIFCSASKTHSEMLVRPSNIVAWEG